MSATGRVCPRWAVAGLAAISLALAGCGGGDAGDGKTPAGEAVPWSRDGEMAAVEIVVDLAAAHDGRIPVEVTAMDGRPTHFGVQSAWSDGYTFHDVRFTDGEGATLPHQEEAGRYRVQKPAGRVVVARYEVEPGGAGRHGNQGVLAADHALFDGRLFLLPQGAVPVGSARIRFVTPGGWTVASPFREQGDWHYVDAFEAELTAKVLGASCVGVGVLDRAVRRLGEMEVRVASYANWDEAHKELLEDKTFRLLAYFHDELGFDLRAPYSVVWVPAQGRRHVFGGSYANGTCFEQPTDRERNWELLGHRIAHAMNEYQPSGMRIRDREDSWVTEGWASYMEERATRATQLAEGDSRWDELLGTYRRTRTRFPERDIALAREPDARDDTKEYVHYVKAPLAMKMLERMVDARSDRSLEQFMAAMWVEYGWHRKPLPFREELESFSGASFEDFWAVVVQPRGQIVPVWEEYLTAARRERMRRNPAAEVGGEPLSGEYLFHLAHSGGFNSFAGIIGLLENESLRRRELEAAGVQLYPDLIRDHLFALDADDRYALAQLERSYPMYLVVERGDSTGGNGTGELPTFEPNLEQDDGRIVADLLARERQAAATAEARGASAIFVRTPVRPGRPAGPARLAFRDEDRLTVGVKRTEGHAPAEIAVLADGLEVTRMAFEPGDGPSAQVTLEPAERPSGNRVIVLRVEFHGGGEPVSRAYWQRSATNSASSPP